MTDAEKVADLRSAIERADKVLDWILAEPGHAEWMLTVSKRVRRILRASLRRTEDKSSTDTAGSDPARKALPKHNFKPWQVKGLVKETKKP